jgi:hypothetical protein
MPFTVQYSEPAKIIKTQRLATITLKYETNMHVQPGVCNSQSCQHSQGPACSLDADILQTALKQNQ